MNTRYIMFSFIPAGIGRVLAQAAASNGREPSWAVFALSFCAIVWFALIITAFVAKPRRQS